MKQILSLKTNLSRPPRFLMLSFLVVIALALALAPAQAQRVYPDFPLTVETNGSDYAVTLSWSDINRPTCDRDASWEVYLNSDTYVYDSGDESPGDSGTKSFGVGPSYGGSWGMRYEETSLNIFGNGCVQWVWSGFPVATEATKPPGYSVLKYARTSPIKNPTSVAASDEEAYEYIELRWNKGSDIPDTYIIPEPILEPVPRKLYYRIYRDGGTTPYATVEADGNSMSWRDTGLQANETHTYSISTYLINNRWGVHESSRVSVTGKTKTFALLASTAEYYNRVKLSWPDVASIAEDIRIERLNPETSTYEEISILNPNATSFSDYDGIPGYSYTYRLTPLHPDVTYLSYTALGSKRPNGLIKGMVKSVAGAGVGGVIVTAGASFAGDVGTLSRTYTDTTDASGYYEMKDVYYYKEAIYSVKPFKANHGFRPDSLVRTISLNASTITGADFTDTTVYTVSGKIYLAGYPGANQCPVRGAQIWVNGKFSGITSAADGTYKLSIENEGVYTITAKYLHHRFVVAGTTSESKVVTINNDFQNIDFEDKEVDTLTIKLAGACENPVAQTATFVISSVDASGCYEQEVTVTGQNDLEVVLPAQAYWVTLKAGTLNPMNTNIEKYFVPIKIDLTARDTLETVTQDSVATITPADTIRLANGQEVITPADTSYTYTSDTLRTEILPRADFIYRAGLSVVIHDLPNNSCNSPDFPYLLEQGTEHRIQIEVSNSYTFDNVTYTCGVDEGTVTIYDDVSDRNPITLPVKDGFAYYTMKAGKPNIAAGGDHPYQKLLQVRATVGNLQPKMSDPVHVLVTGNSPRTATYFTKSPELPFYILHDPMGDASYSYLEKGTTFAHSFANDVLVGGGAGVYARVKVGSVIKVFGVKIAGFFVNGELNTEAGRDNTTNNTITTNFTTQERFSTSSADNFNGSQGDVFIGGSMNMVFAKTDVVDFKNCEVVRDTTLAWIADGLATTYIYTEKHITGTLIPQLEGLYKNAEGLKQDSIQETINLWQQVLTKNEAEKRRARFVENISFSAGAPYESSTTYDSTSSTSYEYKVYFNLDAKVGLQLDIFDSEFELGAKATFRWSKTEKNTNDTTKTTTVGYHLEDNDIGDFFSVDVLKDRVYGTPAFKLVAGTSSCPHEPGTQPRDSVAIAMDTYAISNVEPNKPATFIAKLTNLSQSEETREYEVRTVSTSNLDGAIIKLGGHPISSTPAAFFIPAGETLETLLTVERGPTASTYENLKLIMYAGCEKSLWEIGGNLTSIDTVSIDVYFKSNCSGIALYAPGDNWLVNKNSDNKLQVTLSGYDVNNPYFKSVFVQYRKISSGGQVSGWKTATNVLKSSLTEAYYDYVFDVSSLENGEYEIRAEAVCDAGMGTVYSSVQRGYIDRASLAPFGMPTPADGFLREGQEISVVFDKAIDCDLQEYAPAITLIREDTGESIPFTVQCASNLNKLIIVPNVPLATRRELDGVLLTASVNGIQDGAGNIQVRPVSWSFKVNSKPVFWEPSPLVVSYMQGTSQALAPVLKSSATTNKVFELSYYPLWLTPDFLSGTILPNNSFSVDGAIMASLDPGVYQDSIIAIVDGFKEVLPVALEVLAMPVNWQVNSAAYNYSMNIVAQFSLDQTDTQLSTDPRDVIGVFVNGVARGVAKIQHVPSLNKYAAFVTVYSNEPLANKENLTFRFWRALTGVEYGAKEITPFVQDGSLGTAGSPYILHPEGNFQVIPLTQGWNWVSINVDNTDMSREKLFSSLLSSGNRILVKDQKNFTEYSPGSGWSGTLKSLNTGTGYMLHLSDKGDTLRVVGTPAVINPISLVSGWNWIGYPRSKKALLDEVLSGFNATQGDLLKSATAFANFYSDGTNGYWLGDLKEMVPGKSYKLKVATSNSVQFPNGRSANDGSGFEITEQAQEYNMTVTAMLEVNGAPALGDQFTVAAYVNGTNRGFAQPLWVEQLKAYRLFLTIQGDVQENGAPVEFRVFNVNTDLELAVQSKPVNFVSDLIVGNAAAPHLLKWEEEGFANGYRLGQNKPNPFTNTTSIAYTIPRDEHVKISIYNIFGHLVKVVVDKKQLAGNYEVNLNAVGMSAGMYMYVMETENFVKSHKMILLN